MLNIFTDGSCNNRSTDRVGGYYFVITDVNFDLIYEDGGAFENTSSSRMEMTAVSEALNFLSSEIETTTNIRIYSDSQFIVNSINKGWLLNWVRDEMLIDKVNSDLWNRILEKLDFNLTQFIHIKGHQKNNDDIKVKWNNHCDKQANLLRINKINEKKVGTLV